MHYLLKYERVKIIDKRNVRRSPPCLSSQLWNSCHKWPRICSTCRKHFPVLSSFTMGVTSGVGTAYPPRAPEFNPVFFNKYI